MVSNEDDQTPVGWIDGWEFAPDGLKLCVLRHVSGRWRKESVAPWSILNGRVFEPSIRKLAGNATSTVPFEVEDLSQLKRLLAPGELAKKLVPDALATKHSIFVVEMMGTVVYIPAMLLMRELWGWSSRAFELLMAANSIDMHVGVVSTNSQSREIGASIELASGQPSDTALRRVAWLAQCEDARRSWSSVVVQAHKGQLDLLLPRASLSGWAWGIRLAEGVLACELNSTWLQFDLPCPDVRVRVARTSYACPSQPNRRTGFTSFS